MMMQKKQSLAQNENPYAYTVVQNLKDAGCTDEMVEKFMALQDSEGEEQQLRLLSVHRKHLLEKLHRDERRIDCLDYLIYQMEKKRVIVDKEVFLMKVIQNQIFDAERALYGSRDIFVKDCSFDGPADGESAFKECSNVQVEHSFFNLRYPFWHDHGLVIRDSEMTELCRAALWYSGHITIENTKLHGIKALRECSDIIMRGCDIISPEFGWSVHNIEMEDCNAESEYFMMRSANLHFSNVRMKGKYSFQYIENSVFENCTFDTKDAFWHAKNITVRNSVVKGEYLAWYCENVTFENCKIIGTQPLCYCKGLKLINCEMEGCDLAFERSEVEATITTPVISIKNPLHGSRITVPAVGEIIRDIEEGTGTVQTQQRADTACACA